MLASSKGCHFASAQLRRPNKVALSYLILVYVVECYFYVRNTYARMRGERLHLRCVVVAGMKAWGAQARTGLDGRLHHRGRINCRSDCQGLRGSHQALYVQSDALDPDSLSFSRNMPYKSKRVEVVTFVHACKKRQALP